MNNPLVLFAILCFWGVKVLSAPGEISRIPLGLQNNIPANLMLLYDSSGSMAWDLEQDCETEYKCLEVEYCREDWGCRGNTRSGIFGFGSDAKQITPSSFSWGDRDYKQCTKQANKVTLTCVSSRRYVAENVAKNLMDDIDGFYVGLMKFNGSRGGRLVKELTLLDSERSDYVTQKNALKQTIAGIRADGYTPLSESLSAVGSYFSYATPEKLWLTRSTSFAMTTDTDDAGYVFTSTPKDEPTQKSVSEVFRSSLFANDVSLPTLSSGNTDEERNKNMAVKGWCQKNFLIALTDGEPTSDNDAYNILKTYEKTGSTSEYLANVAGALWDMDLRADLCDPILLDELNDEFGVNMTSCTDLLTASPAGSSESIYQILENRAEQTSDDNLVVNDTLLQRYKNNIRSYFIGFASSTVTNNPLLQKSARLGAGNYYGAKDGAELNNVFDKILNDIVSAQSSSSGVGLSLTLGQKDYLYRARFNTADWSGELGKYKLVRKVGQINLDDLDESWSTNDDDIFKSHDERLIFTWDMSQGRGKSFKWGSLANDHPLKKDLSTGEDGIADGNGEKRLNYIRGDQSNEQANNTVLGFRNRTNIIGDIVHSTPKYVGPISGGEQYNPDLSVPPNLLSRWNYSIGPWAEGNPYTSPGRKKGVVYVNANDGMLHAFDDDTGKEIFAYMPSFIGSTNQKEGLHYLTDKKYAHKFYNDATPYIDEDVWLEKESEWRTLLVSGTAAGGKGIFLLDVTNVGESSFKEDNAKEIVLWEFTHPELGYTYSEPYIGPLRNGKWGVIIGNGYNSSTGEALVFILHVEPDLSDGQWDEGTDFFILRTGAAQADDTQGHGKNGMSTVIAADIYQDPEKCSSDRAGLHHNLADSCYTLTDAATPEEKSRVENYFSPGYGSVDRLYGGDLYGNLWAFNLISKDPKDWSVDYNGKALFQAPTDTQGNPQPITSPPALIWMEPIIQQCDGKKTAIIDRDGRTKATIVGEEFGDTSLTPYSKWNIDGVAIPSEADDLNQRHLTCGPNLLVMFGTGQFLTEFDVTDKKQRAFYAVWDNYKNKEYPLEIDDLDQRTFSTYLSVDDNKLRRQIADVDGIGTGELGTTQWHINDEFGWYVNFDQSGERMVSPPVFFSATGEVFFTSIIPENEICGAGGISILNRVDAMNGTLSKNPRANVLYVGTELVGLADKMQLVGSDDTSDSDGDDECEPGDPECEPCPPGDPECEPPPPTNSCSYDSTGGSFALIGGTRLQGYQTAKGPAAKCGGLSWYEIKQ